MEQGESIKTAIDSYISDMLGVERHIEKALDGQIQDLKEYPDVVAELREIRRIVNGHALRLEDLLEERDAEGRGKIKKIGSALLGFAAGATDMVRAESLPKDLRDTYTACSLATIGYLMLHTTALSLGDRQIADLAIDYMRDYANAEMTLHNHIPAAVIRFLKEEELPASEDVLSQVSQNSSRVWRTQAERVPAADQHPV